MPRVPLATEYRKEARRAPASKPLRPYRMPVALQAIGEKHISEWKTIRMRPSQ